MNLSRRWDHQQTVSTERMTKTFKTLVVQMWIVTRTTTYIFSWTVEMIQTKHKCAFEHTRFDYVKVLHNKVLKKI